MQDLRSIAQRVFRIEAEAVAQLSDLLTSDFNRAAELMHACQGRVVVCGMGKSGIIGKKIAATLSSTGTASFFLHPSEAIHGDLGMLRTEDVFLSLSNSGETDELLQLIPHIQNMGLRHITVVGKPQSTLAQHADCVLAVSIKEEASSLQVAPMASTTATLAMGDALAAALIQLKNFQAAEFAALHPGGSLGKLLLSKVEHFMQKENLPIVAPEEQLREVLLAMSRGQLGLAVVVDAQNYIQGIITDGDIRRALNKYGDQNFFQLQAQDVASAQPKSIGPKASLVKAEEQMALHKITALLVVEQGQLLGVLAEKHF